MFEEKPWQELWLIWQKHRTKLLLACLVTGLLMFVSGLTYLLIATNHPGPALAITAPGRPPAAISSLMTVTITGAVKNPGVYRLPTNFLLVDLIRQAGGFSSKVDRLELAQDLNLASHLVDGQHIFIPIQNLSSRLIGSQASSPDLVSINQASVAELEALPGIGEKRAQDMMAGRPYQSIEELISKKILSASQLEKIRSQLTQ